MRKKLICLFTAALMFAGWGESLSAAAALPDNAEVVRIGFLAYLSGSETQLGVPPQLAMQDYIDEMNANGGLLGKKVELVTYDIARSIDEVVPATTKMVEQDKVIAIVGPMGSGQAIAANPVVTEAGVPLIGTSTTNEKVTVDENGVLQKWMFRVCFIDPYQAEALAGFTFRDLGFKNVAVLGDVTQAYTQATVDNFVRVFTREGGSIVAEEGFNENDMEFRAQLTNIGQTNADAIFFAASNYRYATMAAMQAAELGISLPFLMPDGVYALELLETAGAELEGSYVSTGILDDDPAYEQYRVDFAAKHPGHQANMYTYYALDALMAVEYCAKKAGSTDPAAIRDELERMKDVPVFTGSITIDPATHNPDGKPVTIMKISNSKYEFYEIYKP